METPFIFLCDSYCFELSDFTNLMRKHHHDYSEIIKHLDPLVKDGVFSNWLKSCDDSPMKNILTEIVGEATKENKSTKYIVKKFEFELQLSEN